MTDEELCQQYGVELCLFDANNWHSQGFYNAETKVIGVDINLSPEERHKVLLHELGHIEHSPYSYYFSRVKCENEADRNMIHHLVKDALERLDDVKDFDYLKFMNHYNLKTMTEEIMVKEEYFDLIS